MLRLRKTKINRLAATPVGNFLLFLAIFFSLNLVGHLAQAVATSTIRGAAWWGDNGYVYFNCLDDIIGDHLDVSGNLNSTSSLPAGFHFYSTPCTNLIHAVYLSSNNNFSGQAWNANQGLISFAATTTPDDTFRAHCASCAAGTHCSACYNPIDQKVYGYAQVLSDSSWLKLDNTLPPYVLIQNYDLSVPVVPGNSNVFPGDFAGSALNSGSLGALSFNCETENNGNSNCGLRSYKTYISDLRIGELSSPNWNYSQACGGSALTAVLKWRLKSGQQTAYEIIVNNQESTSTPVCSSGKKTGLANQYIIPNADGCALNYNTNYYWWIRLYDQNDQPTDWYEFGAPSLSSGAVSVSTDGDLDSNPKTFTTYKHEFPTPYFTWDPYQVLVGSTTVFTSHSFYYNSSNPSQAQICVNGQCAYLWKTTDPLAIISSSTSAITNMFFSQATGTTVTLRVTDNDSYVCSTSTVLNINYDLPLWQEVKSTR